MKPLFFGLGLNTDRRLVIILTVHPGPAGEALQVSKDRAKEADVIPESVIVLNMAYGARKFANSMRRWLAEYDIVGADGLDIVRAFGRVTSEMLE